MVSKKIKMILGFIVLGIVAVAASVYAGLSDGGQINVNQKIETNNVTAAETGGQRVNTNTQATQPNGGLRGKGKSPTPTPAPAEPEEVPATTTEPAAEEVPPETTPE